MNRFVLACIGLYSGAVFAQALPLHKIKLPAGFKIQIYADNVVNARSMTLGDKGTVFVGSKKGALYAVLPQVARNGKRKVIRLANHLDVPNGVAFHQGNLYVAEKTRILRFDDIENHLQHVPKPVVIFDRLPTEDWHEGRYLRIGPDQKLYVSVGAPCNVCKLSNPMHGAILRMNLDGSGFEVFAQGVRDSLGLDWQPQTNLLWFTDNGRDELGDDIPPDEINVASRAGLDFGFPYCYGKNIADKVFDPKANCDGKVGSTFDLQAHSAALGMMFYKGDMFPETFRGNIFIAEHGSWNRTRKTGYKIVNLQVNGNEVVSEKTFAEGWLQGEAYWGRPVDVITLGDGSILVSDDDANVIYQISYRR